MAKVKKVDTYQQSELLTRSDVAELFKVSLMTVHKWTKIGMLKPYRMGVRVYYKRIEVNATLNGEPLPLSNKR